MMLNEINNFFWSVHEIALSLQNEGMSSAHEWGSGRKSNLKILNLRHEFRTETNGMSSFYHCSFGYFTWLTGRYSMWEGKTFPKMGQSF